MTTPLWRRLGRNPLLDVGALGISMLAIGLILWVLPSRSNRIDFAHYYVSSRLLLESTDPYAVSLESQYARYGFVVDEDKTGPTATNPPPLLWLFLPVALLSPPVAFGAWVIAQAVCLGVILWLTRAILQPRLSPRGWRFVCAGAIASAPVYWHFYYSQAQLLLAALVLGAYAWRRSSKHTAACLAIASAGLLKIFPFAFLPWFLWGDNNSPARRLRRALATTAFILAVVVVTNPQHWDSFFENGLGVVKEWSVNRQSNFSLPSFVINLGSSFHDFAPPPALASSLWYAGTVFGAALVLLALVACLVVRCDGEARFCLLTIAVLAGSLTTWGNYFVFLIFPVAVMATRLSANACPRGVAGFAVMLLLLNAHGEISFPLLERHLPFKVLANYLPLCGLIALGGFFLVQLRRVQRAGNR